MTLSTVATRPAPYRPAVSKHALAMMPPAHVAAPPQPSAPIPMPVPVPLPVALPVQPVQRAPQWAPIPCHTVLPQKRFRLR